MMSDKGYSVRKSMGIFNDERAVKNKIISCLKKEQNFSDIFSIENSEEPGMPDLLLIGEDQKSFFIEVKYAVNGVIAFKRTQIPWYMRHRRLRIIILAYNDKTSNIHFMTAEYLLKNATSKFLKLEDENNFIITELNLYEKTL